MVTRLRVDGTRTNIDPPREPGCWVARGLVVLIAALVTAWVARRTSWYLSIDQFGYLTFARDIAAGRLSHDWAMLPLLQDFLFPGFRADVLSYTYVYDQGALYCRYGPGFPLIVAAVSVVFGPEAAHLVNPVAMGLLLVVLYWISSRAFGSEWLALCVPLLVTLLPTYMLLWSITPLRDVPAHGLALLGLGFLVPVPGERRSVRRWIAAGLLLGFTVSIRIDAVLYGVPAVALAWFWRPLRRRDWVGAAAAVLIGAMPVLAYNAFATGNPLRPTQAMEVERMLSRSFSPVMEEAAEALAGWVGPREARAQEEQALTWREQRERLYMQGGGLRFSNFARTFPQNLAIYGSVFGALGVALILVGALSALRRPSFFALTVPYIALSTLCFSLWPRPDPRYLAGAILLCSLLLAEGGRAVVLLVAHLRARGVGRGALFAVVLAAGGAVVWLVGRPDLGESSARPYVMLALGFAIAVGMVYATVSRWSPLDPRRAGLVFAGTLAFLLSGVVVSRTVENLSRQGSFQREAVDLARETIESAVGDRAVIFTTSDIGRPSENINFYTNASAVYLREVYRWGAQPGFILDQVEKAGLEAFLLLPPDVARTWIESKYVYPWFEPRMVAEIPKEDARKWFVASPVHDGVRLWLVRMRRRDVPLQVK